MGIGFEKAAKATERLLGFYPQSPASDPRTFMAGVATVLAAYPSEVVEAALSPLSGIPSKFKFMPSIAELKEDLEGLMPRWVPGQAQVIDAPYRVVGPEEKPRPTMEELKAKHGENWGLKSGFDSRRSRPALSIGELAVKYGVPREKIDDLPDAPLRTKAV